MICSTHTARLCFLLLFAALLCRRATAQGLERPYLNPAIPVDERVYDVLSRMTLDEKAGQWVHDAPAIDRLGVPAYNWWSEALHGVARAGYATVFPQAIGIAATWDPGLIEEVGTAISDEARAKYNDFRRRGDQGVYRGLTFWSPNINLFRDPRWGRGMETYGEDPFLTGKCGAAFVRGMQGNDPHYLKLVATMKHFAVHSGPEPRRHTFNAMPSERDLRESYLPQFRMCVKEANVQSVMCAYNRLDGEPCCGNDTLLTKILRQEWGFNGYVTSDCGAIGDFYNGHKVTRDAAGAAAMAIAAGTDLNCAFGDAAPAEAVRNGLLREPDLDRAIWNLLRARFRLGMFDPPDRVPYSSIPMSVVGSPKNRNLALDVARKSIVLLKNEGRLLPLHPDVRRIAVIGPNANDVLSLLGNYYGVPEKPVTPLQGIRERAGSPAEVTFFPGCRFADGVPLLEVIGTKFLHHDSGGSLRPGLQASYFRGRLPAGSPVLTRVDEAVDFNWCASLPIDCGDSVFFSMEWQGMLTPPLTGVYHLGTFGFRSFQIMLDDSTVVHAEWGSETPTYDSVRLVANRVYRIRVTGLSRRSGSLVQLLWDMPVTDREAQAVAAAQRADLVIMALGLSPRLEGEEMDLTVDGYRGGDRTDIRLPEPQRNLLRAVARTGTPVVLLLLNGSAVAIDDLASIPAVLECWYPGQAGGTAIAEILWGDVNPSGRLPVTFYQSVNDLPPFDDYSMKERTYRFFTGSPLFPFGHGLSYTRFMYSGLRCRPVDGVSVPAGSLECSVDIANTGGRYGEEVVQFYVRAKESRIPRPIKDLRGFQRVTLKPGEIQTVKFLFAPSAVEHYDGHAGGWCVEPGRYDILVGASSADIRQTMEITVQ